MSIQVFKVGDKVVKTDATQAGAPFGGYPPGTKGVVETVDDDPNPLTVNYGVMFEGANSIEVCVSVELELDALVELPVVRAAIPPIYYDGTRIQVQLGDAVYREVRGSRQHGNVRDIFENEAHGMIGVAWGMRSDVECLRITGIVFEARAVDAQAEWTPTEPEKPAKTIVPDHYLATGGPGPRGNVGSSQETPTPAHSGLDPVYKDTNPKDALAGYKPRWFSFLPLQVLIGVGMAMFEGGWKYGKHNYRQSGVRASVYVDAAVCGHLMPWMEGEDVDENGRNHIEKAIASLMVLRDSQINGNWIDDRPLKAANFGEHVSAETAHFQTMKAALKEKFGDPVAPYTEAARGQPR